MMSKKDYEKAAKICRKWPIRQVNELGEEFVASAIVDAFVALFRDDNPRFDEKRFREACDNGR